MKAKSNQDQEPTFFARATHLVAVVLISLATLNLYAADSESSNVLQQARALSQKSFRTKQQTEVEDNFATFRRLLPALASTNTSNDGTPEDITFRRVTKAAGTHPELLDELLATYGRWYGSGGIQPRITSPRDLEVTHLTEAYRPAWETLLLAPPSAEIQFMQRRFTITQALSGIRNPESLPVLELAFASTCEDGVVTVEGSAAVERQFRIMECLNRFATKESLQAMLRCLARAETATSGQLAEYSGHDLREWTERFLTDQDNYKTRDKWRQVLSTFPKDNLPLKQRELLDRATRQQ